MCVGPIGFNKQIFGADEQAPKSGCGRCPKNAFWTRELCNSDAGGGCGGSFRGVARYDEAISVSHRLHLCDDYVGRCRLQCTR